jgi:S1-C subfamily serine protease
MATRSRIFIVAIILLVLASFTLTKRNLYRWAAKRFISVAENRKTLTAVDLFQKVSPSMFVVQALDDRGKTVMFGSGVALRREFLITNCHVVQNASSLKVSRGKEEWSATLIEASPEHDLCGVRPQNLSLSPVTVVRPSSKLATGETVYAIGTPEGLELTFSEGVISALRDNEGVRMIQTSAPISPGSSGGGLFDMRGNLVGITTFGFKEGQSLNFALPGEWVSGILSDLEKESHRSDAELESNAWLKIGLEAVKKDDYDFALNSFQKCADLKQSDAHRAWYEIGSIWSQAISSNSVRAWLEEHQRIAERLADERARQIDPRDWWKWRHRPPSLFDEAPAKAIAAFEKAIELKPDYAEAWEELAGVYSSRNECDQTISAAKEATRLAPHEWKGWLILGDCYNKTGSYAEAIQAFQQGQRVAPDWRKSVFLALVGVVYAKKGDREQVLRIYNELKASDPKTAEYFFKEYVLPHPVEHTSKRRSK